MSSNFGIILLLMATFLSAAQIYYLRVRHKQSREKRICDKIKAILLLVKGYSYEHIAEVILLDDSTIRRWHERFQEAGIDCLLTDFYLGGGSYLTEKQKTALVSHLESNVYITAKENGGQHAPEYPPIIGLVLTHVCVLKVLFRTIVDQFAYGVVNHHKTVRPLALSGNQILDAVCFLLMINEFCLKFYRIIYSNLCGSYSCFSCILPTNRIFQNCTAFWTFGKKIRI